MAYSKTLNDLGLDEDCMGHVLAYVEYNDCLRLRRVSRSLRTQMDRLLHTNKWRDRRQSYVTIEMSSESLRSFLDTVTLPVLRVRFTICSRTCTAALYANADLEEWMRLRAHEVTHLDINGMYLAWSRPNEFRFYDSFTSLESLECTSVFEYRSYESHLYPKELVTGGPRVVGEVPIHRYDEYGEVPRRKVERGVVCEDSDGVMLLPRAFNRLTSLTIWGSADIGRPDYDCMDKPGAVALVRFLTAVDTSGCLERLRMPYFKLHKISWEEAGLKEWVRSRVSLRRLQLSQYRKCNLCFRNDVIYPLLDSKSISFEWDSYRPFPRKFERPPTCVTSVVVRDHLAANVEYPSLVQAVLPFQPSLSDPSAWARWDNLKALNLYVTQDNWQFAFSRAQRPPLRTLILQENEQGQSLLAYPPHYMTSMLIMTTNCPNLTFLELRWLRLDDKFYNALWRGLPLLEYLKINECFYLGDAGFIGKHAHKDGAQPGHLEHAHKDGAQPGHLEHAHKDGAQPGHLEHAHKDGAVTDEPVFCKLRRLRYLELLGLFKMKLTGAVLEKVICNMPIRFLRLSSHHIHKYQRRPSDYGMHPGIELTLSMAERFHLGQPDYDYYKSLNWGLYFRTFRRSAIEALKTGVFATTVEKLDMTALLLYDATFDELMDLGKQFRSNQML